VALADQSGKKQHALTMLVAQGRGHGNEGQQEARTHILGH
jgi:hypothetical protein